MRHFGKNRSVDNRRTRRLRDPTLHFFVVWLLAPIFAIVGASLDLCRL
jgi:hypothetical protein